MSAIDSLLEEVVQKRCSDLHYVAGQPPRVRQHGDIQEISEEALGKQEAERELMEILPEAERDTLAKHESVDFAHQVTGLGRFRVNVFRHLGGMGGVFRHIPEKVTPLEELQVPEVIENLCRYKQGLVLVTGKTGSGKSTTLASMIDRINETDKGHVITIEDPIEFVHQRKRSLVSQREVGTHVADFATALRSALREDPDVILIGELRDLETISLAVRAAEMGILVFSTLHTSSAITTVDRLVNVFPFAQQGQVRNMLATSLRGVVAQQLVKRTGGDGRVAAMEILVNTHAVANILREGKTEQLEQTMRSGQLVGMVNMDNYLHRLVESGTIDGQQAYAHAFNKQEFEKYRGRGRQQASAQQGSGPQGGGRLRP